MAEHPKNKLKDRALKLMLAKVRASQKRKADAKEKIVAINKKNRNRNALLSARDKAIRKSDAEFKARMKKFKKKS